MIDRRHTTRSALVLFTTCAALLTLGPARPAQACELRLCARLTNYELVVSSAVIVLAQARDAADDGASVGFEVVRLLRGAGLAPGDAFDLRGELVDGPAGAVVHDFARSRLPETGLGYLRNQTYLLFLEGARAQGWELPSWYFCSRVDERVAPEDDAWVAAVSAYVAVAELPEDEARLAALLALQQRGEAQGASLAERQLAQDVSVHLDSPGSSKSFAELRYMYRKASRRERLRIWDTLGRTGDPEARAWMARLVTGVRVNGPGRYRDLLRGLAMYYLRVEDPAVVPELAAIYLGELRTHGEVPGLAGALRRQARAGDLAIMERVIAATRDDDDLLELASWFVEHPSPRALRVVQQRARLRYASHPALTAALAMLGDPGVVEWAAPHAQGRDLDQDAVRRSADGADGADGADDRAPADEDAARPPARPFRKASAQGGHDADTHRLAIQVIASSPTARARQLATALLRSDSVNRVRLIRAYGTVLQPHAEAQLVRLRLADPDLSDADLERVSEGLAAHRERAEQGPSLLTRTPWP